MKYLRRCIQRIRRKRLVIQHKRFCLAAKCTAVSLTYQRKFESSMNQSHELDIQYFVHGCFGGIRADISVKSRFPTKSCTLKDLEDISKPKVLLKIALCY
jgi:hypothetical protein